MLNRRAFSFCVACFASSAAAQSDVTIPRGEFVTTTETITLDAPNSVFRSEGTLFVNLTPPARVGVLLTEDAERGEAVNAGLFDMLRPDTIGIEARGRNAVARNASTMRARAAGQTALSNVGTQGRAVNDGLLTGLRTILQTETLATGIAIDSRDDGIAATNFQSRAINTGRIEADAGVVLSGRRPALTNSGEIDGRFFGVVVQDLEPSVQTDVSIFNDTDGLIEGGAAAIDIAVNTVAVPALRNNRVDITNRGVIRTTGAPANGRPAIRGNATAERVVNSGLMEGDIDLADGSDIAEVRAGGQVNGNILLGDGQDSLFLDGYVNFALPSLLSGGAGNDLLTIGDSYGGGFRLAGLPGDRFQAFETVRFRRDRGLTLSNVLGTGTRDVPLSGSVTVDRGTLFLRDGAAIETGLFILRADAALVGDGTILGTDIRLDGSVLPGSSAGPLTFGGPTTIGSTASVALEIFDDAVDQLVFAGPLTVADGAMFSFVFDTAVPEEAQAYLGDITASDIFSLSGQSLDSVFGARVFATNLAAPNGTSLTVTLDGETLVLNGIAPVPIPLPSSVWALLAAHLTILAASRARVRRPEQV